MATVSSSKVLPAFLFSQFALLGACGSGATEPEAMMNAPASADSVSTEAPSTGAKAASGPAAMSGSGAPAKAMTASTSTVKAPATAAAGAPAKATTPEMQPASSESSPDAVQKPAAGSGGTAAPSSSGAAGGGAGAAAAAAGSVAAAGSSGAPAAGSEAPAAPPREVDGKGDGSDVITIGDSWMSNTLGTGDAIQGALQRLNMQPYRHYAVQGVMLMSASAFGAAIPSQYQSAKRLNPDIKTVVMTGGGNDIIQNPTVQAACNEGTQECVDLLNKISDTLNELWTEMAADGVQDVVFIRYSKDAGSTSDKVRGMQKPIEICSTGKIRCHSIDSTEAVMAELQDGIHPTRAANDRLAKVIWGVMESENMRR